jgi:hypothetical protein
MTDHLTLFFDEPEPVVVAPGPPMPELPPAEKPVTPPAPKPDLFRGYWDAAKIRREQCQYCNDLATQPLGGGRQMRRDPVTREPLRDRYTNEVIFDPSPCPPEMRAKYPALWCQQCWDAGRWKDGVL